jgi:hypothetical protein
LTKVIIWAEINTDQLEINGRLNNEYIRQQ